MRRATRRPGGGRSASRTLARACLVALAGAGCSGRTPLGAAFAPDAAAAVESGAAHDAAPSRGDAPAAIAGDASVDLVMLGRDVAASSPDADDEARGDASLDVEAPVSACGGVACPRRFTALALGGGGPWTACALVSDGTASCWASGTEQTSAPTSPVAVPGLTGATTISVDVHACARLDDGRVACWSYARAGDPSTSVELTFVPGLHDAIAVSAGDLHSCAVRADGTALCWGTNGFGELGDGHPVEGTVTTPVAPAGLRGVQAIEVGEYHTCALVAGGHVSCWGHNDSGQLGDGTTDDAATPVDVATLSGAVAIRVKGYRSCALLASGGVTCWGSTYDAATSSAVARAIPALQPGLEPATALAVGWEHACIVIAGGRVQCWGENNDGQLGNGTSLASPAPVTLLGVTGAIAVAASYNRSCALVPAGGSRIACWGMRNYFSTGFTTDDAELVWVTP